MRRFLGLVIILLLTACGQNSQDRVETVPVGSGLFEINLHADGGHRQLQQQEVRPLRRVLVHRADLAARVAGHLRGRHPHGPMRS